MGFSEYIGALTSNDYFSAGFGLIGVGALLGMARRSTTYLDLALRKYCLSTIEIPSKDKSYDWVLNWLATQKIMANRHTMVNTSFDQLETGRVVSTYNFHPATGTHLFFHKGFPIKVERTREKSMLDVTRGGIPYETLRMTTIGRGEIFSSILEEAHRNAMIEFEGKTITFIANGTEWIPFGYPKKRRPLSSVVLEKGLSENIHDDIKEFISNPRWYIERGIPYRRGYLLYGPPGCGKTSFITAIAGEIFYNLCVLNLSERGLSDDRLHYLLNTAPQQSIIVLEDIDSPFTLQSNDAYMVSRSGLLNALDGVASSEERIIFMTTNYVEKLDPALIRPGRVDVSHQISFLTAFQIEGLFKKFYPESSDKQNLDFTTSVTKLQLNISPAQLCVIWPVKNLQTSTLSEVLHDISLRAFSEMNLTKVSTTSDTRDFVKNKTFRWFMDGTDCVNAHGAVKHNGFNPYTMNGGTVVGIAGKDFAIVGADTRLSEGYIIQTRGINKLHQLTKDSVIGSCGFHGDVTGLMVHLKSHIQNYELTNGRSMSSTALVQLLSVTLYYKRFFPYYVYNIVGGIDSEGCGFVYSYDPVGSHERESYRAAGTAASLIQPFLDNIIGEKNHTTKTNIEMTIDRACDILISAFNSASERDIYTGDNLKICIITKDGVNEHFVKLRHD